MAETLSLLAVEALKGGGGGGGDVNVDNVTLQKENDTLSFKVKSASDKEKVWKIKSDGTWDLSNINEWKAVSTFVGLTGNTYTLYILTQDTTYEEETYKVGFYTWDEVDGFVLRSSDSEVFTDVGINENLPTTDINDMTIYRKAYYEYKHNSTKLENEPVGYKILDTTNISVSSTGITIDSVETLWDDLTDVIVEGLITNDRLESAEFDEADFFNYDTTLYDIATNFEREIAYRLYHNPTATVGKYILIGGGSSEEVLIDNETITENSSNELQANAIIDLGNNDFPTTSILTKTYYRKSQTVSYVVEEVSKSFTMTKMFLYENGSWVSYSEIKLTQEEYDNLPNSMKIDNTTYIVDGNNDLITQWVYGTLEGKPVINGITLNGRLTLEDLDLYSRDEIEALLAQKGSAEFVNQLPATLVQQVWYYSKKYADNTDVPDDKRALYIVDKNDVLQYMGVVGDVDLSNYYTKSQIDDKLDLKQDEITDSDVTSDLTDNSKFSLVSATNKTNQKWTFAKIWDWITGKLSTSVSSESTDKQIPSAKLLYDMAGVKYYTDVFTIGAKGNEIIGQRFAKIGKLNSFVVFVSTKDLIVGRNSVVLINKAKMTEYGIKFPLDTNGNQWYPLSVASGIGAQIAKVSGARMFINNSASSNDLELQFNNVDGITATFSLSATWVDDDYQE